MANSNYLDKLRIGGVDRPVRDSETEGRVTTLENKLGSNNGIATLGADGKVPSSQLPSYVDDVIEGYLNAADGKFYEENTYTTEIAGESGKIYVNLSNEKSYRWSGSAYTEISSSDVSGIKVGPSGQPISPSGGIIELPAYEVGAQVNPGVMGASGNGHASGLVPDPGSTAGTTKYLREDGTWQTPPNDNTTYSSETAAQGGTAVSLVTTGEKYDWNNKQDALAFINNDYNASTNKVATQNDIPTTLPASDVSSWAKAASKPSYAYSEIGYTVATASDNSNTSGAITLDGEKPLHVIALSGAVTSVAFTSGKLPAVGHSCHVIFTAASATTVTLSHIDDQSVRYICPAGEDPDDLEVPAGGYVEIDFLRAPDTTESNNTINWIYVRGI